MQNETCKLEIVRQPSSHSAWLIPYKIAFGSPPSNQDIQESGITKIVVLSSPKEVVEYFENVETVTFAMDENRPGADEPLFELAYDISKWVDREEVIYITCSTGRSRSIVLSTIVISTILRKDPREALIYVMTCYRARQDYVPYALSQKFIAQIQRYQRPLRVIFCGDRSSAFIFEEQIEHELKLLPPHSVVIHGACRGVDSYVAELAQLRGIPTVAYPAKWDEFGSAAGPIRNREMLKKERPDKVIAFHPDIRISHGTKDMVMAAWKEGVPVIIHDRLKKIEFRGDIDDT